MYSVEEKQKYYSNKAHIILDRYKLKSRFMSNSGVIVSDDLNECISFRKIINSKRYDKDMYLYTYYLSRSLGNNHNYSVDYAKKNYNNFKFKQIVHISDVANVFKRHIKLDD